MNKIEFEPSKMQVRFRVQIVGGDRDGILLATFESYSGAEEFCWRYDGKVGDLEIRKVWISK